MTTAILTFQNSDNFGALLQAYALQTVIRDFGEECILIDYYSPNKGDYYDLIRIGKGISLRSFLGSIVRLKTKLPRRINANEFRKKHLTLTKKRYYSSSDIEEDESNWENIIVGSDQVWNFENTKFDKTYFLDFVSDPKRRYSYAASFGISAVPARLEHGLETYLPKGFPLLDEYTKLLSRFNKISVREEAGRKIVKDILDENVEVVLDPTLLLNKEKWLSVLSNNKSEEPYILIYSLDNQDEMYERAVELSKQMNIPIKQIFATKKAKKFGIKNVQPGIIEFVQLINDASLIITDSFHGTAFSVNLNKLFYSFYHEGTNKFSRIENLLEKMDLKDRIMTKSSLVDISQDINFEKVNYSLNSEREKSLNFLETIITNQIEA